MNLTDDELSLTIRAVHEKYVNAVLDDEMEKARILENARDKLEE